MDKQSGESKEEVIVKGIGESSANIRISLLIQAGSSLTNIRKNNGPNTLP